MRGTGVFSASLTPSAATLACLDSAIVGRLAVAFRHIHAPDQLDGRIEGIEAPYKALSTLAFVAPAFRVVAQRERNRFLVFRSGKQVHEWLDCVGERKVRHRTAQFVFFDTLPFREGDAPGCKWSYVALRSLFSKVVGVKAVSIFFFCQASILADLLSDFQLAGKPHFRACSPLVLCSAAAARRRLRTEKRMGR